MAREVWKLKGADIIHLKRDKSGVPRAKVQSEEDLYRALGYCHAKDRGLQMLLVRILAQGRACELLQDDEAMLEVDRFFRRIGIAAGLEEAAAKLDPDVRALVRAYCDGAEQAFAQSYPWELRVLRVKHTPWRPTDSLMLARVVAYVSLAQSQGEMERFVVELIQAGLPDAHLRELFPGQLDGLEEVVPLLRRLKLHHKTVPDGVKWGGLLPRMTASNNWVVAGSKTRSGKPMLANDPHLEINRLPAIWYEFVGQYAGRYVISATMPGLPGFLLGRTGELSWGATYAFSDAEDSWIEERRGGKLRRLVDGQERWITPQARVEVIRRKKHPPLELTFHETEHGTLDGPLSEDGLTLSTRWAGAGLGAASLRGIVDAARAQNVEQGMAALGKLESAFNWVLADRQGNIGYQMSGTVPRRRPGASGLLPLPGWDAANDWLGWVTPEELPRQLNPACGYIATANDDLNALGKVGPINLPMGAWRAERIRALLAEGRDFDPHQFRQLHMDVVSPQARAFVDLLRPLLPDTPAGRLLKTWDCRYTLSSRAATLFETLYEALLHEVFAPVWGADLHGHLARETATFVDFAACFDRILLGPSSAWFGDRTRDEILRAVVAKHLDAPVIPWGEKQRFVLRHVLLGDKLPGFAGFNRGPLSLPGGRATIHQGQLYRSGGRQTSFAPSWRFTADMADDLAHTSLPGGPSDRRFSPFYASGLEDWAAGRTKPLLGFDV